MNSKFYRPPRKPLRLSLRSLGGELSAERFSNCDMFLRHQGAHQFFRTGRLSPECEIQVGVFKKGLQLVRLDPTEKRLYEPWQASTRAEILTRAQDSLGIGVDDVQKLRQVGDPAIHIMDRLEELRMTDYQDVAQDMHVYELVGKAYSLILSSIHGSPKNSVF